MDNIVETKAASTIQNVGKMLNPDVLCDVWLFTVGIELSAIVATATPAGGGSVENSAPLSLICPVSAQILMPIP